MADNIWYKFMNNTIDSHFIAAHLIETWQEVVKYAVENPRKVLAHQLNFWQTLQSDYPLVFDQHDLLTDKRFKHDAWKQPDVHHFIAKSYCLVNQVLKKIMQDAAHENDNLFMKKLRFYMSQTMDALSPSNFHYLNPEILNVSEETNGANIIAGFQNFLKDLENNNGQFKPKITDENAFTLGKNIACTPGKIVFQNDIMQLIYYTPTTTKIAQYPLIMIPPWINKYYILDLQQSNSLVQWLVNQGIAVFMISWVNPDAPHRHKQFADYMLEGSLTAIKIAQKITRSKHVNCLGYCIGGTLLACMLASLAKRKNTVVKSATFITTLIDFSEPGELGVFIDERQLALLETHMYKKGYLEGSLMTNIFNALRANDLIWSNFVNNYLKGQNPRPFDLLYWNADATNIPADVHAFYLRNMYLNNSLIQPNRLKLNNTKLDISQIQVPCYFLAAKEDHLVPWRTCYQGTCYLKTATRFVLTASGHVAGVVNPPNQEKYGYWTHPGSHQSADQFLDKAQYSQGSWWPDWFTWLKNHSGSEITYRQSPSIKRMILDDAPGSYVQVRI